jgi:hypothetical protein
MKMAGFRSLIIVLSAALLSGGCGGGSSSGGGSFSTPINGTWIGTWENDGLGPGSENQGFTNEGLVRAELNLSAGGSVSGTATWTGLVCLLNTTVTGVVSQGAVSLTFVQTPPPPNDPPARVTFNGRRISDSRIDGRWDNDFGCIGEGDMTLNREL